MARPAALLMLADGTAFPGEAVGAAGEAGGEVVFTTSMSGYQEILTDPSAMGQLITFTYPHLGNCGANPDDNEAPEARAAGLICTELNEPHGQWRSRQSLDRWMAERGLSGIAGVDTRALTLHLREHGSQNGYMGPLDLGPAALLEKARALPPMAGRNLAEKAGCREAYQFAAGHPKTVAVLDLGARRSSLGSLEKAGFSVRVWPYATPAESILESGASGLMVAGGPGDPAACSEAIETVKKLLGRIPLLGLGLGHQILALALGGRVFSLPFGHRAGQPVREEAGGRIIVTTQNHGFCVEAESLPPEARVTHRHAGDGTVEGFELPALRAFSIQHHAEDPAGSVELLHPFSTFRELIARVESEGHHA